MKVKKVLEEIDESLGRACFIVTDEDEYNDDEAIELDKAWHRFRNLLAAHLELAGKGWYEEFLQLEV
jgi:hypothetical protein